MDLAVNGNLYSSWCTNMRPRRECIRCITSVRLGEVINTISDEERSLEIQLKLLEKIRGEFMGNNELTIIASNIFEWLISEAPEIIDYYRGVRRRAIDKALENIGVFREYAGRLEGYERFRFAVKVSIAGNILDMGVHGHTPPENIGLEYVLNTPLAIDDTYKLYRFVREGGRRITWLFDNAGESIYDTVMIDLLRSYDNTVIGIVKNDPGFQNDLTISDVEYAGLDKHLDDIIPMGAGRSTIHLDKVSRRVIDAVKSSNLVVSKGMANYEYLSGIDLGRPIAFLLVPKCRPVADSLGVEKNVFVAYLRD